MGVERITNLCRPFGENSQIFCLECCLARPGCPLLSWGEENKPGGCLGHGGKIHDGLSQLEACARQSCWDPEKLRNLPPEKMSQLIAELTRLPPGRYNPEEILRKFELR